MMETKTIAIIGGGNLGAAFAEGLLKKKVVSAGKVFITRRRIDLLDHLAGRGVNVLSSNSIAVSRADIIILAIKPYQITEVLQQIAKDLTPEKIVISLASGVELADIQRWVGSNIPVFRAMPNTAIALGESLTCIAFPEKWRGNLPVVSKLFTSLGEVTIINEELMAAATVLGSCGIAFALRFMRAAMQGGVEIGFSAEMARFITAQTMKGACELILKSKNHPEQEIDKVTTPMGITISGLNEMEHNGFSSSLIQGLVASYRKIEKR